MNGNFGWFSRDFYFILGVLASFFICRLVFILYVLVFGPLLLFFFLVYGGLSYVIIFFSSGFGFRFLVVRNLLNVILMLIIISFLRFFGSLIRCYVHEVFIDEGFVVIMLVLIMFATIIIFLRVWWVGRNDCMLLSSLLTSLNLEKQL
jgi:hypothetical protein